MLVEGTIVSRRYKENAYSKKQFWVALKIEMKDHNRVRSLSVTGTCDILPSMGDWMRAKGKLEQNKYGENLKAEYLQILEPKDPQVMISRLADMKVPLREAQTLVERHKQDLWKNLMEGKLFKDETRNETIRKAFEPWKRSNLKDEAIQKMTEHFETLGIELEEKAARKIILSLDVGAVARVKEDPLVLAGLIGWDIYRPYLKACGVPKEIRKEGRFLAEFYATLKDEKHLCLPDIMDEDEEIIESLLGKGFLYRYSDKLYVIPPKGSRFLYDDEFDPEEDDRIYMDLNKGFWSIETGIASIIHRMVTGSHKVRCEQVKSKRPTYEDGGVSRSARDENGGVSRSARDENGGVSRSPSLYEDESESSGDEENTKKSDSKSKLETNIQQIIDEEGLCEEQANALRNTFQHRVSLICGPPGTGKSRLIRALVRVCALMTKTYFLMAPTGSAVKRIRELTQKSINENGKKDVETSTVHSYVYSGQDPIDYVIVDEASMMDSVILYRLLAKGSFLNIVLIGDPYQLKPVGPGFPFFELIKSGVLPITYLTRHFRFDEESSDIPIVLEKIKRGETNLSDLTKGFTLTATGTPQVDAHRRLLKILKNEFNPEKARLITSLNKDVRASNEYLHPYFNEDYKEGDESLQEGDWVMNLKNDKDRDICNGDIGLIKEIKKVRIEKEVMIDGERRRERLEEIHFFIEFEIGLVELPNAKNLVLAYCGTVHKCQGAETDNIVVYLTCFNRLGTRSSIYTAVSRGRKRAYLFAPVGVLEQAIRTEDPVRHSCLALLLRSKLGYTKDNEANIEDEE